MDSATTEIAEVETDQTAQLPALSETATVLQIIQQAALNPDVDIDKMERLLEMQERIMARDAVSAYNAAFAKMQPNLPSIIEKGKGHNSTYALWEHTNLAIKPILAEFGFGLSFKTEQKDATVIVTAILIHKDGHSERTSQPFPFDKTGSKNDIQAIGSAISYGKRYMAFAVLNLTSHGEDDDGFKAGLGGLITDEQATIILGLISDTETDIQAFCNYLKVPSVSEIPLAKFGQAEKALQIKKAQTNG